MEKKQFAGYAFAVAAAVAYGTNSILVKAGLSSFPSPLAGATIAMCSGILVLSVTGASSRLLTSPKQRYSWDWPALRQPWELAPTMWP